MTDLEDLLRAWGYVYGQNKAALEDRSLTGESTLARIAGKPKTLREPERYGQERRRFMAAGSGMRSLPSWAVAAITCTETRSSKAHALDPRETPELLRIQAAWLALYRVSESQATAVRLRYQVRATREDRAKAAGLSERAYKDALREGRAWLYARLAA